MGCVMASLGETAGSAEMLPCYGFNVQGALSRPGSGNFTCPQKGAKTSLVMDIHHIRYFLAVCETLNFTRAAEACNVTQPALSRAIQQLEDEVGGLLFRRERSLTHLTDFGLLMKPHFTQIMSEMGDIKRDAQRFLTLDQASVTLGVMCTIGPTRFTGLLADFRGRHPGVSLKLVEGDPKVLTGRLEKGELDVALLCDVDGFPERFDRHVLYKERFVIAFAQGHRLSRMNAVPVRALDGENYLKRINCEYYDYLSQVCNARGVTMEVAYASEREDWIQNIVAGGMGVCFIPEFSAVLPGIQVRLVIDPEIEREISLVTVAGRRLSPSVLSFLKAVKEYRWAAGVVEAAA